MKAFLRLLLAGMSICVMLTAFAPAFAPAFAQQAVPTQRDPVAARREHDLAMQLRCLVCQNQTIAESNAELAVDLRNKVREQIAAGRSDREIIDYMTARYGDFVLYRPPFKAYTAVLWLGPALLLVAGVFVAWRVLRARRQSAVLTPEQHALAQRLLNDENAPELARSQAPERPPARLSQETPPARPAPERISARPPQERAE